MDAIRTVIIFSPVSEKYIGSADLASFSLVLSSSVIISTLMFGFIEQSYERGYGVSETLNKIVNTGIPIILLIFLSLKIVAILYLVLIILTTELKVFFLDHKVM